MDGGVDCQGMRDTQGRLWSLTGGDLARFRAGERVLVRGTVPDVSVCVRGTALQVDHIERIPTMSRRRGMVSSGGGGRR